MASSNYGAKKKRIRREKGWRIRKNGMEDELFLDRRGKWTDWDSAAVFESQDVAERFAKAHGIRDHRFL